MKKKCLKLIVAAFALALCISSFSFATTYYYSFNAGCDDGKISGNGGSVFYNGKTAKLKKGCFVQYIYAGPNENQNSPSSSGGVSGDDVLLLTGKVGSDEVYLSVATFEGEFYCTYTGSVESSNPPKVYVRVWSTYEADLLTNAYYGNSSLFTPDSSTSTPPFPADYGLATFEANNYFDKIPPGPPSNFNATQEASGDIILSWTATIEPDASGTRIRYKLGSYPANETDGTLLANIPVGAGQTYRHVGLENGTMYFYGAFSYDTSGNFSAPATTDEASSDTLPPSVSSVSPSNGQTGISSGTSIDIEFNDNMGASDTQNSFSISPSIGKSFIWLGQDHMRVVPDTSLDFGATYICTVDVAAKDDAGNSLISPYTWWFTVAAGSPPQIFDMKIDGWKRYPGDIISPHPKISATITDPELGPAGIAAVKISANTITHTYSSSELSSVFDNVTGYFDARFPGFLPRGTYAITLEAWDVSGNSSSESAFGLVVRSAATGGARIEGFILNYPSVFKSGAGTTVSYTLTNNDDIVIYIYSIKGKVIYQKRISSGSPGGMAGYNEMFWNGLSNFGETLGSGMYIVKITSGDTVLGTTKIIIQN